MSCPADQLPHKPMEGNGWSIVIALLLCIGCSNTEWVRVREKPDIPLAAELNLFSGKGPKATPRTKQLLRRYDLDKKAHKDPLQLVTELQEISRRDTTPENVFATAEIAYISGIRAQDKGNTTEAFDLFGLSVANAYSYLLGDELLTRRNPYDPRFRQASDIYNGALESALRIVQKRGQLKPETTHVIATQTQQYEITIQCRGPWRPTEISELKFTTDYEVQGLQNHYRTYGLGVPLIAVHNPENKSNPADPYYAPGMSFPVTAFLQVLPGEESKTKDGKVRQFCVLELHDPMMSSNLAINEKRVPLETDLSTPLAYCLNDPTFRQANESTQGLLNRGNSQDVQGLYMLEPYDANKIPVLMVHGLWSNLVTWMEMFNDLRGNPEIRDHYQFWFYLYPTGQPFWLTAAQLRSELAGVRRALDPRLEAPALDQLVLVGHSMGGLIAKMQTVESGRDYWSLVSEQPSTDLAAPEHVVNSLRQALYFGPNPSVKRVVTIASPHRGSNFSNNATQWIGRKVISLPDIVQRTIEQLSRDDTEESTGIGLLEAQTSIDTLSPTSPVLGILLDSKKAGWVKYHNVMGRIAEEGFLSKVAGTSDGVVTTESAHLEEAESELVVEADHLNIHRHPKTVLEVQRVLLRHLNEASPIVAKRKPAASISRLPTPTRTD
ncbi:MAG: hypothetical protein P8N76_01330 [Pirellulaceae bacterium]|nr:hypothetical protein [Pirellulaceae bacterium]